MSRALAGSTVEEATLSWFKSLGYAVLHGPDIAPGELFAERATYGEVVLVERLRSALARINPNITEFHLWLIHQPGGLAE